MGNSYSTIPENHVFEKELLTLNTMVHDIISSNDVFNNKDYNFLSQNVCAHYNVVLETELQKHLKIEIASLGTSLYILPKKDDGRLSKHHISKDEICKKITNHYLKILYVICLVKYVYNVENNGDFSIAGIVLRNIKIVDDMMEINFCDVPHKDHSKSGTDVFKIDFAKLEGIEFFTKYVLDHKESSSFIHVLKAMMKRSTKYHAEQALCDYKKKNKNSRDIEKIFYDKYGESPNCRKNESIPSSPSSKTKKISLSLEVAKDNPVFSKNLCYARKKLILKISKHNHVLKLYENLKSNYEKNVREIEHFLHKLVEKKDSKYVLKDITKPILDEIIEGVKSTVKVFYLQSISDFQNLLDAAKKVDNIGLHED